MPLVLYAWLAAIGLISTSAQQQQQPRVRFGPGVCGPLDPSYVEIAEETGGHVFPVAVDEMSKLTPIMMRSDQQLLLRGTGAREYTYSVPIDSSVQRVWLYASFDGRGGRFTVVGPDGKAAAQAERIEDVVLNCGRILTIDAPAPGIWELRVAPTSRFWLVAEAKTESFAFSAEFADGEPAGGATASLRVRFDPHVRSAHVMLVALDGVPVAEADLDRAQQEGETPEAMFEFTGTIKVPIQPFRMAVSGLDERGAPYQRMEKQIFRPASR